MFVVRMIDLTFRPSLGVASRRDLCVIGFLLRNRTLYYPKIETCNLEFIVEWYTRQSKIKLHYVASIEAHRRAGEGTEGSMCRSCLSS